MSLDNLLVPNAHHHNTLLDRQPQTLTTAQESIAEVHQLNTDPWYNQPVAHTGWTPLNGPGVTSSSLGPITDANGTVIGLPVSYALVAGVLAGILIANRRN